MDDLLGDCLQPVMLGSNTTCHAAVRLLQKRFGAGCTVLTGKRALTLRFFPGVRLVDAPPSLSDDILLAILQDIEAESTVAIPLLVLCDKAYDPFVSRNILWLESHFVLRRAEEISKGGKW